MLRPFKRSDVLFKYNWSEEQDYSDLKIVEDTDDTMLDRSEGNEMIYFISSLVKTWGGEDYPLQTYQNLEKIIHLEVPNETRTYSGIMNWIVSHYDRI